MNKILHDDGPLVKNCSCNIFIVIEKITFFLSHFLRIIIRSFIDTWFFIAILSARVMKIEEIDCTFSLLHLFSLNMKFGIVKIILWQRFCQTAYELDRIDIEFFFFHSSQIKKSNNFQKIDS